MFCKKAGGPGGNPGAGPQTPKALVVETLVATRGFERGYQGAGHYPRE